REVEVAARGTAGGADVADDLARLDGGPDRGVVPLQVVVAGDGAVAVVDLDPLAGGAVVFDRHHGAGLRGLDRGPAADGEIDALMELGGAQHGVGAVAVPGADRSGDRLDVAAAAGGRRLAGCVGGPGLARCVAVLGVRGGGVRPG